MILGLLRRTPPEQIHACIKKLFTTHFVILDDMHLTHNNAMCTPVVAACDGAEPLLPCSVPLKQKMVLSDDTGIGD